MLVSRGIKFSVNLPDKQARGFVLEVFGQHFTLPELGPIGANSMAQSRDFKSPVAAFEDVDEEWTLINKYMGRMFQCTQVSSVWVRCTALTRIGSLSIREQSRIAADMAECF